VTPSEEDEDKIDINALWAEFKEKRLKGAEKQAEAVAEIVSILKATG